MKEVESEFHKDSGTPPVPGADGQMGQSPVEDNPEFLPWVENKYPGKVEQLRQVHAQQGQQPQQAGGGGGGFMDTLRGAQQNDPGRFAQAMSMFAGGAGAQEFGQFQQQGKENKMAQQQMGMREEGMRQNEQYRQQQLDIAQQKAERDEVRYKEAQERKDASTIDVYSKWHGGEYLASFLRETGDAELTMDNLTAYKQFVSEGEDLKGASKEVVAYSKLLLKSPDLPITPRIKKILETYPDLQGVLDAQHQLGIETQSARRKRISQQDAMFEARLSKMKEDLKAAEDKSADWTDPQRATHKLLSDRLKTSTRALESAKAERTDTINLIDAGQQGAIGTLAELEKIISALEVEVEALDRDVQEFIVEPVLPTLEPEAPVGEAAPFTPSPDELDKIKALRDAAAKRAK